MELNSFEILRNIKDCDLKSIIKSFYVFERNTLFVTIDDKVFGFGYYISGFCGQRYDGGMVEPIVITELCDKNVIEFFNGDDFVLCLTSDNKLFSWGENYCGQLGIGCVYKYRLYSPQLITSFSDVNIVQVCCGYKHSLVLTEEGVVYGWGDNRYGQTGVGQEGEQVITSPTKWSINGIVIKIHCSLYQSYAITSDGRVYCCGYNDNCQLGSQLKQSDSVFILNLHDIIDVESIITSWNNTYFVTRNGDIYCCGKYILIDGKIEYKNEPTKISIIKTVKNFSCSNYYFNCLYYGIIYSSDIIYEFHNDKIRKTYELPKDYKTIEEYFSNIYEETIKTVHIHDIKNTILSVSNSIKKKYYQLYMRCENNIDKFEICDSIPKNLKKIIKYLYVFKFYSTSNVLFVTIDDKVFGMGRNYFGVLGLGHDWEVEEVEIIPKLCDKGVKEFFKGRDFVLCLTSDGNMYGWGMNDYGQLGIGSLNINKILKPYLIEFFSNKKIIKVCCGKQHSSVLTSDGRVYLWGYYNNRTFEHPIECEFVLEIKLIHCSNELTFCSTKNGKVYYWEYNDRIELFFIKKVIDSINHIEDILNNEEYTYFISRDSIAYVFRDDHIIYEIKFGRNLHFRSNFHAISFWGSECVIYNNDCVYVFKGKEFFSTKYKNPFDYFCDEYGVTFETIEFNVIEEDIINANQITNHFMNKLISEEEKLSTILEPFPFSNRISMFEPFIRTEISSTKFKIMNKIGEGAFGNVYRIKNLSSNEIMALKIINIKSNYCQSNHK